MDSLIPRCIYCDQGEIKKEDLPTHCPHCGEMLTHLVSDTFENQVFYRVARRALNDMLEVEDARFADEVSRILARS